ncbi:MAG: NUDIX domain-containing protein [Spirochaetota bacterium]|nr:NUDIX domain-containing protein [Spirochaetota bacterium]
MAILEYQGKILFTIRAKNPAKDKLDFPGGFIDPGENAEMAIEREIKEELDIQDLQFTYLGSAANNYEYKDIIYSTCDLIFTAIIKSLPRDFQRSEIKDIVLLNVNEIKYYNLAFPSVKRGIELYLNKLSVTTQQ